MTREADRPARFAPIAIVGRACVLPGALGPEALWDLVRAGGDAVISAPEGIWGLARDRVLGQGSDRAWTDRGGYVQGFERVWDPGGFGVDAREIEALDPLFQWTLHTAREALRDAGHLANGRARTRTGAILGNLSFPTQAMSRYAANVWLEGTPFASTEPVDPKNRFMSGLPAHLLARALGVEGPRFALDAACASSLYAIALACDALHTHQADTMLAGAVNRADDLFIHIGFCALQAMSKSGRSRPFHPEADGLVPAEGAALLVLRRLEDAVREGERILGVIRGVGLANDGRGRGLLAPHEDGQIRAMRAAYEMSGIDPASIEYVECHATGTPVGDATEIRSMSRALPGSEVLPIGSFKANVGHLVTVAGAAGLLKVLASLEHETLAPTPHLDRVTPALDGTRFRVVRALERWRRGEGPRRAAVSAFGFGGNDAHLVIEEWCGQSIAVAQERARPRIAIVGVGARVGDGTSRADLANDLALGRSRVREGRAAAREVALEIAGLRFPPRDLEKTIAQQTMLLAAARECAAEVPAVSGDRASVIVGMGTDPEVARWGARWRLVAHAEAEGWSSEELREAQAGVAPPLEAAIVVGTMPNIPANRINSQLDVGGASFTVSAEEASGLRALEVARRALERGEIDLAYVGAVDASAEPVHERALRAVAGDRGPGGDAAIVLALMREDDARVEGATVLAVIDEPAGDVVLGDHGTSLAPLFGRAHAAWGLLHVAAGALAIHHGTRPALAPRPSPEPLLERRVSIAIDVLEGERATIGLREGGPVAPITAAAPPRGPVLTLPAHPTAPRAPVTSRSSPAKKAVTAMQKMDPAPALPAIMNGHAHPAAELALRGPQPPTAAPRGPSAAESWVPVPPLGGEGRMTPAVPSVPAPRSEVERAHVELLARAGELQRMLGELHKEFLTRQGELHQQFLKTREVALFTLLNGVPAAPAPRPRRDQPALESPIIASAPPVPLPTKSVVPAASQPTRASDPRSRAAERTDLGAARPTPASTSASAAAPTPAPVIAPVRAALGTTKTARPRALTPDPARPPTGRTWSREDLCVHAGGKISTIFGPLFEQQDHHAIQVRMPMEPMLLADRVVGIDATPGVHGKGTVWTETDVRWDSWYLHEGRMPAGILIEAGQADLFLISYMGADFLNQGKRAYRLLGCELTYHRSPPRPGETIRYEIHVDGHAKQGDVRLFFFHYDCRVVGPDGTAGEPVITVRNGQAGFFTRKELDDSAGILWTPEGQQIVADARVDGPAHPVARHVFAREHLDAFAAGDPVACFGDAFRPALAHVRTPRIAGGRMLFFDRVDSFDPRGGPWKRGYLKATREIAPDDWFFPGHFLNDPCMPGTLMFEGCLQAMAFYVAAMGYTVSRDGWRFEPIPDETYKLLCRGQVTPESKELVYEVFVEEIHDGPIPILYADLRCTVDGLGAFHARRMGLRLVPDWPITSHRRLVAGDAIAPEPGREPLALPQADPHKPVAVAPNGPSQGFRFDYASLIACAWGQPSTAFGKMYERFDGTRKVARLPGPPYHFMSRVTQVKGAMGEAEAGAEVVVEYDVPPDAWYFRENGAATMPLCVLMEVVLQPCGWLASYVGSALTSDEDLLFRNLDGKGTQHAEVVPTTGTIRTHAKLKSYSKSGTMIIVGFDVRCTSSDGRPIYTLDTVFGFFPNEAFENQAGLPTTDAQRALARSGGATVVDLRARPARLCSGSARIAAPFLLMLDRVVHWDPAGGAAGLGAVRAEKDVDPGEWFFKAHFFQDPVQPGSLGIEAMCQLLQIAMLEKGLAEGIASPRFEPIALAQELVWKYRGQVVPTNGVIGCTLEITEILREPERVLAKADASLWVDGKRIYEAKNLGMRIKSDPRSDGGAGREPSRKAGDQPDEAGGRSARESSAEETIDPARDRWIVDHQPTWTIPAMPAMSMLDRMADEAAKASGREVIAIEGMQIQRWITAEIGAPAKIRTSVRPSAERDVFHATIEVFREARDPRLSRFELAASARVRVGSFAPGPAPLAPPADARPVRSPYEAGQLFHGPIFRRQRALAMGATGSSARIDARVPEGGYAGRVHPILLDAATHGVPHDAMESWCSEIPSGRAAYPYRIERATFHGPAPREGEVRCEARFVGYDAHARVRLQLIASDRTWCEIELVEVLLPKGPIGTADPADRVAFLRDRAFVPGVALARSIDERTSRLEVRDVAASNWLPGTVERVYGIASGRDVALEVAVRDHVGQRTATHPSRVSIATDVRAARSAHEPLTRFPLAVDRDGDGITVRGAAETDLSVVREFWREWLEIGPWPGEDLTLALIDRFVRRVRVVDPDAFAKVRGRSALYLANHQVGIESLLFGITISALTRLTTLTLAKKEHAESWLGRLIRHLFAYPGLGDPRVIAYFDRNDPASLPHILKELGAMMKGAGKNVTIHVEGTRARSCAEPVVKMSGVFVDLAIQLDAPIVPVRFVGGLPRQALAERLEFPVGMGRQDYYVGAPIEPAELASIPYKDRTARVLAAINALGPGHAHEEPLPGDPELERAVRVWEQRTGASHPHATIFRVLESRRDLGRELAELVQGAREGRFELRSGKRDAWTAELARRLFGPNGPAVVG